MTTETILLTETLSAIDQVTPSLIPILIRIIVNLQVYSIAICLPSISAILKLKEKLS